MDEKNLMRDILAAIERGDAKIGDMETGKLAEVMSHPKAAAVLKEVAEAEKVSIRAGDPAPDFTLPRLMVPNHAASTSTERVTLSEHYGDRPVALIFGSYT